MLTKEPDWRPPFDKGVGRAGMATAGTTMSQTHRYQDFLCGWGASVINITATFPINKAMFRQQLQGINVKAAIRQLQEDGFVSLYRGLMPPLMQKSLCMAIMFGSYQQYRRLLKDQAPGLPNYVNKMVAAMLAGTTEAALAPFERVQALLQDKKYHGKFTNTLHAFSALRSYGIREYYRGLTAILMRNGPSNCAFFLFRGKVKQLFPETDVQAYNVMQDFVSGALLGSSISTIFFPLNVVKTRMQCTLGGEFISFRTVFWSIYHERNQSFSKMFRGVHINLLRSLLSWGIINASYELLLKLFFSQSSMDS